MAKSVRTGLEIAALGVVVGVTAAIPSDALPSRAMASVSPDAFGLGELHAVSAVSTTDVWAAGFAINRSQTVARTLIRHWDGRRWSRVRNRRFTRDKEMHN